MSEDSTRAVDSPPRQVARLMDGYLITQVLYAAVRLGIAEALAGAPQDAEMLAGVVGAQAGPLRRLLRGLASEGFLEELADGRFGLTQLGTCLRGGVPDSMRGAIIARGAVYYAATAGLLDAVRHGGTAFERIHGLGFFEYLRQHPGLGAAFQDSMADRSQQEAADVVSAYDFTRFGHLVDVGGGQGILLEAILRAAPRLHGVLMDQPAVVEAARSRLAAGLSQRCTFAPGDFFATVPLGGSAYLLSRVIHDWNDEEAVRILANCRRAMEDRAALLLVEAILPERAQDQPAAIRMDLHMLTLLHGHERTAAEYERLLVTAGLRLVRIVPTRSPTGLSVIEGVPAP